MPDFRLIGEHIDYALFGVFPSAICHDVLVACAPRDSSGEPSVSWLFIIAIRGTIHRSTFLPFIGRRWVLNYRTMKRISEASMNGIFVSTKSATLGELCKSRILRAYSSSSTSPKLGLKTTHA